MNTSEKSAPGDADQTTTPAAGPAGRLRPAAIIGAATVAGVVCAPVVVAVMASGMPEIEFDVGTPMWQQYAIGYGLGALSFAAILIVPSALWGSVVGRVAGVRGVTVAGTAAWIGPVMTVPVVLTVHFSQLLIDVVSPWHRLAVHALFAVALTIGIATFLGVVAARVGHRVCQVRGRPLPAAPGPITAAATAVGVLLGAVLAVLIGWTVQDGAGVRMLWALLLALLTGSAAGGAVFGWLLAPPTPTPVRGDSPRHDGPRLGMSGRGTPPRTPSGQEWRANT